MFCVLIEQLINFSIGISCIKGMSHLKKNAATIKKISDMLEEDSPEDSFDESS